MITQNAVGEKQPRDVLKLTLLQLRRHRAYLERALNKAHENTKKEDLPVSTIDTPVLRRLSESLDDYRRITERIEWPHTHDPKVVRIRPELELSAAAGIQASIGAARVDVKLREDVDEALQNDAACRKAWQKTRAEAVHWTPAARLSETLFACFGSSRAREILHEYFQNSPHDNAAIAKLVWGITGKRP